MEVDYEAEAYADYDDVPTMYAQGSWNKECYGIVQVPHADIRKRSPPEGFGDDEIMYEQVYCDDYDTEDYAGYDNVPTRYAQGSSQKERYDIVQVPHADIRKGSSPEGFGDDEVYHDEYDMEDCYGDVPTMYAQGSSHEEYDDIVQIPHADIRKGSSPEGFGNIYYSDEGPRFPVFLGASSDDEELYEAKVESRAVALGIGSGLKPRIQVGSSKGGIRKSVLKRPGLVKKVIEIDDMTLKIGPGCLTEDTEITLINCDTDIAMKSLLDLGLVDAAPRVVEFLPDGLKFLKPADLTIKFEKIVSDSELFIFHGSYNNNWQRTIWELVTNGIEENIVGGVVNVKINSFCLFSYIFAKRGKLARILSHLNHSFTCRAYVFYRRLFSMDTIDVSVVLLSEFVDEKEEEDIKQLKDHFEAGYVKGEKGMLKRVRTDRPLEMCVDFPGVESVPFSFGIVKSLLDSVGFVIDHVKGVPVKSPASGTVKISSYTKILWKLTIYEMNQEIKVEEAYVLSSSPDPQTRVQSTPPEHAPEVVYRTTKLTNGEISQISRKVGIDWDSLAGLMDIPYSEREEIRVNFGNYLSLSSKAKRVFELFNDSKCFGRHILVKYFEELRRHDLKNEMLPMEDEDEGEDVETPALQPEISEVPLRDNTPLSFREMYRLSQRIVVDWDRLAGLMDITRAERDDIRYSLLYNNSRSRAEKILSIFNQREDFSRKKLAGCFEEIQQLELVEPVTTGEWRRL